MLSLVQRFDYAMKPLSSLLLKVSTNSYECAQRKCACFHLQMQFWFMIFMYVLSLPQHFTYRNFVI